MLAQERYEKILNIIEEDGSVKVSMLTKLFNVSIETIRRDLDYLEKEGYLKKVYGGAVLEKVSMKQLARQTREKENIEEKKEIADIAVRFISEGQSIAMNASTTNLEIAKVLKLKCKKLTVITNSLLIASELADMDKYTIILTGGIFRKEEFSLVGGLAKNNISEFNVDTAFISVSGVSLYAGITDYDIDELQIQKQMINISQQVIVLADSSKIDTRSLLKVEDLNKINMIITDSTLKKNILQKYNQNGIEIINK
ncbi:DeoR/GlpR family DNA-binding transcription regulator [Abyssisolibacter fermentans]|uniref:DeoR/GlpR family DNA-binding transcription regulator n=1 Tax=Abyssisolibacter fermentans TaxID=1766203 RepID=UPI000833F6CB|nr:DeoR/GlpR family DNA-binding transcription regulator [Abyssisolibacter fermentans]